MNLYNIFYYLDVFGFFYKAEIEEVVVVDKKEKVKNALKKIEKNDDFTARNNLQKELKEYLKAKNKMIH